MALVQLLAHHTHNVSGGFNFEEEGGIFLLSPCYLCPSWWSKPSAPASLHACSLGPVVQDGR